MKGSEPDVIVIGGGAAGLMCAIEAGRRGRSVWLIEHANRVGKKILMSGGGRCNFTNLEASPQNYLSANPHFCKSALAGFTQWDFIARVQEHGIAYHEKELGQLFCDESSKQILQMLLDDCAQAGVRITTKTDVLAIRNTENGFAVETSVGAVTAESVIVASGGLSFPTMGATGFGYELARQFGHAVLPTRAGLVPLTLSGKPMDEIDGLSGIACPVSASANNVSFRSAALFTHRGLSGPAILQISSYWKPGDALHLDLLPDRDATDWLLQYKRRKPAARLAACLAEALPQRLAQRLCELEHWDGVLQDYPDSSLGAIGAMLNQRPFKASGTEGYRTAEVTLGGVSTDGLSSKTMESKRVPGLFFIGEVVDVTGWLGGYNFQWAWSSGFAAGQVC